MDEVLQLLEEWGMDAQVIDSFRDNCIDMYSFKLLALDNIKELIPKVGPRLNFIEKWNIYNSEIIVDVIYEATQQMSGLNSGASTSSFDTVSVISSSSSSMLERSTSEEPPAGRICGTCCRPINDRYILQVVDISYHEHCLQCYACGDRLYQTCFVKESKLFCRIDYDRLYVKKCLGCSERIAPEELVMRTCENVFHVRCFACVVCGMRLQKGDHYVFKQGQVFCKPDYEKEVEMLQGYSHADYFCDEIVPSTRSMDGRRGPKRPRTILTTQQRRAFKASFEVSPKPCRKVRETLAKDTGLSIRIVQVWFQNQRAKMKKMKKKAGQDKSSTDLENEEKKISVKEEEQSPGSTPFMNDSCSDSETGKDIFAHIKPEANLFLNIKEEPDSNGPYFKSEDSHLIHQRTGMATSGKFHNSYVGFPFSNLDSGQLSMLMTPPPAHKNVMTHGVHLDINPIDRLYSMQNSYFCAEESSMMEQ